MAEPSSRIGATVAVKRTIQHGGSIDIVTLGNSRAEDGLDHELLRSTALKRGFRHLPATLRGAHWVTWVELSDWIEREHGATSNALIAVSVADLFWATNGAHEIGMIEPLRKGLIPDQDARQLFDRHEPETYGVWSSLLAYRADFADYVHDPMERHDVLAETRISPASIDGKTLSDICRIPTTSIADCAGHTPEELSQIGIVKECRDTLPLLAQREDWTESGAGVHEGERSRLLALRQRQLSGLPYRRPLVVLMPVLKMWRHDVFPNGYEKWVEQVLGPLVASGRISLIDATTFFDTRDAAECTAFVDLYHQNQLAAEELTKALLPRIDELLYQQDSSP
ncbi:MAG: hypothetical protein IPK97_03790 [Ahniella sp.]|nr:hypothetical protein [Ahniella sp.]